MCEHCEICEFNQFPAMIMGGPTGDYFIECPVQSARYAEYQVVSVINGAASLASVVISGDSKPAQQLNYTGAQTLNDDVFLRGQAYRLSANQTIVNPHHWDRITHSQKRVFARIDVADSNSVYVVIRFRVRLLTVVPMANSDEAVLPGLSQQANLRRSSIIQERNDKAGIPKRIKGDHAYA